MLHRTFFILLGTALFGIGPQVESGLAQDERVASHSVGMLAVEEVTEEVKQAAREAVWGPDAAEKSGPMAALGTELALLYHQHEAGGETAVQSLRPGATPQRSIEGPPDRPRGTSRVISPVSADGRTVVIDAVATEEVATLLDDLRALGLEREATAGAVVSGRLPIASLREAAQLSSLRGMAPSYMRVHAGSVESEADTSHRAYQARAEKGVDGGGEKVCALSDSYDTASSAATSASDDIESGDLPGNGNPEGRTTTVDVLSDYDGDDPEPTDEGRAMLQLIHDIAPGAELGFHTAFGGIGNFAEGIGELAAEGCGVIVDDVGYSNEPFYQDGPVSNAVDDVVENEDVVYFSSAGNNGQDSYEAPFRNSGESGVISSSAVRHDFDSESLSTDTEQRVTVEAGGTFQVFSLQWTDPSAQVDGSDGADTDLDIALVDQDGEIVAESSNDNIESGVPSETMEYTNNSGSTQELDLVIEKAAGPDPDEIKYVYSGNDFSVEEYDTLGPTVFGHPMAEGAMAVAAAPFYNTAEYNPNSDPAALEPFSAKGGIQIRFDQSGAERSSPEDREKPDVTGTDGIDNTFFGEDLPDTFADGVDADPHPNFFGTSAAAPNIAAIGALIRNARPDLSPTEVYDRLESTAADVTVRQNRDGDFVEIDSGVDPWSGHGFVQANEAVPTPTGVQIANLESDSALVSNGKGELTLRWRQIGDENVDELVVERRFFSGAYEEVARLDGEGAGDYRRRIDDLAPGAHRFRVTAVERTDTDGDGSPNDRVLARESVETVLRAEEVDVTVYPNPFQESARLSVTLPEDLQGQDVAVQIQVYNALGQRVAVPTVSRTITDSESIRIGARTLRSLSSGMYFFRVIGEGRQDDADFVETVQAVHVQ
ncbi:MAG: S8 family serine peptidase [Salinivenus sp.]